MTKHNLLSVWKDRKRPLILDGANGGVLQEKVKEHNLLWSSWLNIENPNLVISLHSAYIEAGAEIITTNTFRTNPHFYNKYKLKYSQREFVTASVHLAKLARGKKKVLIAGSNPPAEECYQPERTISPSELSSNHITHINLLYESGVDFVLNETQSHFDELKIICRHCSENKIPYVVSLLITPDLKILSGESVAEVIDYLRKHNPMVVSFNCFRPETYKKLIPLIPGDLHTGFYFNCHSGHFDSTVLKCDISPAEYVGYAKDYADKNTVFVGSCCGSNPAHTKKIRALFDEKN